MERGSGQDEAKAWDTISAKQAQEDLFNCANQVPAACLNAPHAENGLRHHTIPVPPVGSYLDQESPEGGGSHLYICKYGSQMDDPGQYADSAPVISRHRALQSARLHVVLEPVGLDRSERKCLDGITILPFVKGRSLAWDTNCRHPYH